MICTECGVEFPADDPEADVCLDCQIEFLFGDPDPPEVETPVVCSLCGAIYFPNSSGWPIQWTNGKACCEFCLAELRINQ